MINETNPKSLSFEIQDGINLTVAVPEIGHILEIQKMKICSEVPNFMGRMNFWLNCA